MTKSSIIGVEGDDNHHHHQQLHMIKQLLASQKPKKHVPGNRERHVDVGVEGHTPKKVIPMSSAPSISVVGKKVIDVGEEGHTPVKMFQYVQSAPPSDRMSTIVKDRFEKNKKNKQPMSGKKRKINPFSNKLNAADFDHLLLPEPQSVDAAESIDEPDTDSTDYQGTDSLKSPLLPMESLSPGARPTTSRGKSHPSPDEFYSYVVPSPEAERRRSREHDGPGSSLLVFRKSRPPSEALKVAQAAFNAVADVDEEPVPENEDVFEILNLENDQEEMMNRASDSEASTESKTGFIGNNSNTGDDDVERKVRMLGCWLFGSALRI